MLIKILALASMFFVFFGEHVAPIPRASASPPPPPHVWGGGEGHMGEPIPPQSEFTRGGSNMINWRAAVVRYQISFNIFIYLLKII
jgi:hypothetical protein